MALTPDAGSVPVDELGVDDAEPLALLLGAEGPGLSADTLAAADVRAGIPMRGGVTRIR